MDKHTYENLWPPDENAAEELEDPAGIRAPVQAGILYYIDSAVRTVILRDHAAERIWLYYH